MDISFKVITRKGPFYIFTVVFCHILTGRRNIKQNPAEIILAWPNMWTNQNLCVAHARRIDDVLWGEYY